MARPLICDACNERAAVCVVTMTETGDVYAFCGQDMVAGFAAMLGQLTGLDVAAALDAAREDAAVDLAGVEGNGSADYAGQDGTDELSDVAADLGNAFAAAVAAAIEAGMTEDQAGEFVAEAFNAGLNPFDVLAEGVVIPSAGAAGPDDDDDDDQDETPEVQSFASEDSLGSGTANALDMSGVTAEVGEYLTEQPLGDEQQDRAEAANYA